MWYQPDRPSTPVSHAPLPRFSTARLSPADYVPDAAIVNAVNVALVLRKPLLVAGEPGVGKSTLAYHIALLLNLRFFAFYTKSTSSAQDLLYTYDVVQRLRDAQAVKPTDDPGRYVTLGPLGQAIYDVRNNMDLRIGPREEPEHTIGDSKIAVLLINEIDKGPRDFANDFLQELEFLSFTIKEANDLVITAQPEFAPIVIITTNSERVLPDTLLRRCIFHTILFPSEAHLVEILRRRLVWFDNWRAQEGELALRFFQEIRAAPQIQKRPGISELFDWTHLLAGPDHFSARNQYEKFASSLPALIKTEQDLAYTRHLLDEFLKR
jgi:MoxR-like ATPase